MTKKPCTIVVIDDDPSVLDSISEMLTLADYDVETLTTPYKLPKIIREKMVCTIILDVMIPGYDGLEILKKHLESNPEIPVIMISGKSTITIAVRAVKMGAYDFLEKAVNGEYLIGILKHSVQKYLDHQAYQLLLDKIIEDMSIIGQSAAIKRVISRIGVLAKTNMKVLILGETGTGKELVAKALHYGSERADMPYVKVNCAAIPSELMESELFGYVKGAFTGAHAEKIGKFALADGGTIFLDEIGDLSLPLQAKLLRVLQDGELEVLGSTTPKKVDVRILSATNKDLNELIKQKLFREDLFHRLNVGSIAIPPLRDRKDDIPLLMTHFFRMYAEEYNRPAIQPDRAMLSLLSQYNWPGNVRELKNLAQKLVIYSSNNEITEPLIRELLESGNNPFDRPIQIDGELALTEAENQFEKDYLLKILNENDWNILKTSRILKIDRSNLYRKLKKHGIQR